MDQENTKVLLIADELKTLALSNLLHDIPGNGFSTHIYPGNSDAVIAALHDDTYDIAIVDESYDNNKAIYLLEELIMSGMRRPVIYIYDGHTGLNDLALIKDNVSDCIERSELTAALLQRSLKFGMERLHLLENVFEKELKYRALFERSIDAIFIAMEKKQLIEVNHAMLQLLEYTREEMVDMKMRHLFAHLSNYKDFKNLLKDQGIVKSFEATLVTKNNHRIYCLLTVMSLTEGDGTLKGYQGVVHDISKRKKAERALMRSEKLAMSGRLARNIAHEVRNPLTTVTLAIDQLQDLLADNHDSELYLDIIKRNSARINMLIKEFLDSARAHQLRLKKYSIHTLIEETMDMLKGRLEAESIDVNYKLNKEDFMLRLDPMKLGTALVNLIVSSINSMPGGGTLTITTNQQNHHFVIRLNDTGMGMDEKKLKNLFDPFAEGKKGDFGLGLTAAQSIISGHKGDVEVESEPGKGTTFIISLPLYEYLN